MNNPRASNRRYLPTSPFKPPPEDPPVDKYGLGRVILVESGAVVVDSAAGKMWITAPFARMTRL
jgi:hypothetical protein